MVAVENFGDSSKVACKISLRALRYATTTPGNQDVFGEAGIGILDFQVGELDAAFVKVFN